MTKALIIYTDNLDSIWQLHKVAMMQYKSGLESDVSEIYRAELVLLVSAFDAYMHDILADLQTKHLLTGKTWKKMMLCRFGIPPHMQKSLKREPSLDKRKVRIRPLILKKLQKYTYQRSYAIANGFKQCGVSDIWSEIGSLNTEESEKEIMKKVNAIINERNGIVHQAHRDAKNGEKMPMTEQHVDNAKDYLTDVVKRIDQIVEDKYL